MSQGSNKIETPRSFPTWCTVRRGVYRTLIAYISAMRKRGHCIGGTANILLPKIVWAQEEGEEELVKVLDRDLGLTCTYTFDELVPVAARLGLYLVDADVAAGACEQSRGMTMAKNECAIVGMEEPVSYGVARCLFSIASDGTKLSLCVSIVSCALYQPGEVWIFTRRKPASAT